MAKDQVCAVWQNSREDKKEHHRGELVPLLIGGEVLSVCKSCQRDLLNLEAFMKRRTTIGPKESVAKFFVGGEKSNDTQSRSKSKKPHRKQSGLGTFREANQFSRRKSAKTCIDTPLGKWLTTERKRVRDIPNTVNAHSAEEKSFGMKGKRAKGIAIEEGRT
jgi:hypothetical protein